MTKKTKDYYYLTLLEVNHQLINFPDTPLKHSVQNRLTNILIKVFYKLAQENTTAEDFKVEVKRYLFHSAPQAHSVYLQTHFPRLIEIYD